MRRPGIVAVGLGVALLALGALVWADYVLGWTGFHGRTLWDWLDLLFVPAALGVVAALFTRTARLSERAATVDRARESALETYLEKMSQLLLDKGLAEAQPGAHVQTIARARTLAVLRRLDGERKAILLRFLHESHLIGPRPPVRRTIGAESDQTALREADLGEDVLRDTPVVDLKGADLFEANLREANLNGAHLTEAHLDGAHLNGAYLTRADLTGADLTGAYLIEAHLDGAHLIEAHLDGADLTRADLTRADLIGATVSLQQLGRAWSLKGATMPDGTTHE